MITCLCSVSESRLLDPPREESDPFRSKLLSAASSGKSVPSISLNMHCR